MQEQRRRQEASGNALGTGDSVEKEGKKKKRKVVVVKLRKPGAKEEGSEEQV